MFEASIFHTYPVDCLRHITTSTPVFIEADACFESMAYRDFFYRRDNVNCILDCGVGASPNVHDPKAHVSKDPSWAARYLDLALELKPSVVVVPDVLNDGEATAVNFKIYGRIFQNLRYKPYLLYVIQGETLEDALFHFEEALENKDIDWIGFPRIVKYYLGKEDLNLQSAEWAIRRLNFLDTLLPKFAKTDKRIHMLGMSDLRELRYAALNKFSIDTRLASMAAISNFSINEPRPDGLNINLTDPLTYLQQEKVIKNMHYMNEIYHEHRSGFIS